MSTTLPATIDTIKQIAHEYQATRVRWPNDTKSILVDAFTASAIATVYASINAENQAKFIRMIAASPGQFYKVATFCLKNAH